MKSKPLTVGDAVILKGQRKGRYHLEGGILVHIDGGAAVVVCDHERCVLRLDELEPYSPEYSTPQGVEIVPIAGNKQNSFAAKTMPIPNHWADDCHFAAATVDGRRFIYCPIGNICSWHPGDHDNRWCHWCKKSFTELEK